MIKFEFSSKLFWALGGPVLFCALLFSNATLAAKKSAGQPDWVTQPPSKAGMAYGTGSMEVYGNPQAAIARATELARVDLVSQLQVTVSGDFSSTTTMRSGTHRESEMQKSMSNYVRSQIPTVQLKEVKVADTWVEGKVAYVLVELNRSKETAQLSFELDDLDSQIEKIANAKLEGSTLQQLRTLLPALALLAQREQLVERLKFISVQHDSYSPSESIAALEGSIGRLINALEVQLVLKDAGAKELRNSLLEGLTQQGLRVSSTGGTGDLLFIVNVSLTNKQQSGSHYTFANAQIQIEDSSGRVINAFSQQAKGVSGMADVSRQKAAQNLAQLISEELAQTLVDKIR